MLPVPVIDGLTDGIYGTRTRRTISVKDERKSRPRDLVAVMPPCDGNDISDIRYATGLSYLSQIQIDNSDK